MSVTNSVFAIPQNHCKALLYHLQVSTYKHVVFTVIVAVHRLLCTCWQTNAGVCKLMSLCPNSLWDRLTPLKGALWLHY